MVEGTRFGWLGPDCPWSTSKRGAVAKGESAAQASATAWTPGFFLRSFLEKDSRTFRSLGAHSGSPRFAISMVVVVVFRCRQIQFLASHSAARIGRGFRDRP